jgi:hypothetical protein
MVYNNIQGYWVFRLWSSFGMLKNTNNTTFRKLDLFSSSGEELEAPTMLDPLDTGQPISG